MASPQFFPADHLVDELFEDYEVLKLGYHALDESIFEPILTALRQEFPEGEAEQVWCCLLVMMDEDWLDEEDSEGQGLVKMIQERKETTQDVLSYARARSENDAQVGQEQRAEALEKRACQINDEYSQLVPQEQRYFRVHWMAFEACEVRFFQAERVWAQVKALLLEPQNANESSFIPSILLCGFDVGHAETIRELSSAMSKFGRIPIQRHATAFLDMTKLAILRLGKFLPAMRDSWRAMTNCDKLWEVQRAKNFISECGSDGFVCFTMMVWMVGGLKPTDIIDEWNLLFMSNKPMVLNY